MFYHQADYFMSWGKSAVRSFVDRARKQKIIEDAKARIVKEKAARAQAEYNMKYWFIVLIIVLPLGFCSFLLYAFLCPSKGKQGRRQQYRD